MKLSEMVNPLNWGALALQIVGGLIAAGLLFWYVNSKLEDYYTEDLQKEVKAASIKADLAIAKRESENGNRTKEALNAKVKTLESNLAAATSTAESRISLLNTASAIQQRTQNSASACAQYSAALGEILATGTELAGQIAKEADGHAADSLECRVAWPK